MHPSAAVRLAFASEASADEEHLRQLSTDLDAMVSYAARWQLRHRLPARPDASATGQLPTTQIHTAALPQGPADGTGDVEDDWS